MLAISIHAAARKDRKFTRSSALIQGMNKAGN